MFGRLAIKLIDGASRPSPKHFPAEEVIQANSPVAIVRPGLGFCGAGPSRSIQLMIMKMDSPYEEHPIMVPWTAPSAPAHRWIRVRATAEDYNDARLFVLANETGKRLLFFGRRFGMSWHFSWPGLFFWWAWSGHILVPMNVSSIPFG